MYQFVRQVLDWDASEYGYWITYRNLLAALGKSSYTIYPFIQLEYTILFSSCLI